MAVAVPPAPGVSGVTGDPTWAPSESLQVPSGSGWSTPLTSAVVSCDGEHRKNVTVPVGLGAVPPLLLWPVTVAVSVIEAVEPRVRSAVDDGVVVMDTVHSPSVPRA